MSEGGAYQAVAQVAREVSDRAYQERQWNYDSVECAALTAVGEAFARFADLIEMRDSGSSS